MSEPKQSTRNNMTVIGHILVWYGNASNRITKSRIAISDFKDMPLLLFVSAQQKSHKINKFGFKIMTAKQGRIEENSKGRVTNRSGAPYLYPKLKTHRISDT